jgi:hypothetical protein
MPSDVTPRRNLKGKRHSTSMMVGGIIVTGLAIPLEIATIGAIMCNDRDSSSTRSCDGSSYVMGGLMAAGALLAVGIPLISVGGKRDAAPSARLTPWATPQSAGLRLRLDL